MKKFLFAVATVALLATSAQAADKIGVSMALFDDNFLTVLRNGKRTEVSVTLQPGS